MSASNLTQWEEMIQDLVEDGTIRSEVVRNAMLTVDRRHYVPYSFNPYLDAAVPIGYGATISAPHMHALTLELLKDQLWPGARALDVGSGSGYLTACMAIMVGPSGLVVGIDHVPNLIQLSKENVLRGNRVLLGWNNILFKEADGRLGYPELAPYDAINVGAATQNIPLILVEQLAPGGRLVIPVGNLESRQFLTQVDKRLDGNVHRKKMKAVRFVPLTDRTTQERTPSQIELYHD